MPARIFAGRLIRDVKNGPAPKWVQDRLKAVGMKSISALVDATNLIAQDRGRPLHVFDADKLSGNLHARMAKDGEQVLALDGKTYVLDSDTVVIADDKTAQRHCRHHGRHGYRLLRWKPRTSSSNPPGSIPARVARAGRKLGIVSDARYRFERGVDPQFVLPGLELCTQLILEWCGGEASDVVIAGELPPPHKHIDFDPSLVETLGGIDGADAMKSSRILSKAGLHRDRAWRHFACDAAQLAPRHRWPRRSGGRDCAHSWPCRRAVGAAGTRPRPWRSLCSPAPSAAAAPCAGLWPRAASMNA